MSEHDEYFESARNGDTPYSDFMWYASDREGSLAVLISAGEGVIPKSVFTSREFYYEYEEYLESLNSNSGYIRSKTMLSEETPCDDDITIANCGLYVYDYSIAGPPYTDSEYLRFWKREKLYAHVPSTSADIPYRKRLIPGTPLNLSSLPTHLSNWLEGIKFQDLLFSEVDEILPREHFSEMNFSL